MGDGPHLLPPRRGDALRRRAARRVPRVEARRAAGLRQDHGRAPGHVDGARGPARAAALAPRRQQPPLQRRRDDLRSLRDTAAEAGSRSPRSHGESVAAASLERQLEKISDDMAELKSSKRDGDPLAQLRAPPASDASRRSSRPRDRRRRSAGEPSSTNPTQARTSTASRARSARSATPTAARPRGASSRPSPRASTPRSRPSATARRASSRPSTASSRCVVSSVFLPHRVVET